MERDRGTAISEGRSVRKEEKSRGEKEGGRERGKDRAVVTGREDGNESPRVGGREKW